MTLSSEHMINNAFPLGLSGAQGWMDQSSLIKLLPDKGSGLRKLGSDKTANADEKRLKEVCQSFESIFIKLIMSEMRKTVKKTDLFGGNTFANDVFTSMLDSEIAENIARAGGIGLTDKLYDQLKDIVPIIPADR